MTQFVKHTIMQIYQTANMEDERELKQIDVTHLHLKDITKEKIIDAKSSFERYVKLLKLNE